MGSSSAKSSSLSETESRAGLKNVAAGANPISIKLGMEKASQYLVTQINEFAQPVEDIQSIQHVASISAAVKKMLEDLEKQLRTPSSVLNAAE